MRADVGTDVSADVSADVTDPDACWLGVDLGTQGVRAAVVRGDGRVLGRGAAGVADRRDGPRHEQDPTRWWTATAEAVRAATRDVDLARLGGVAACGTSGTVLLTDRAGRPMTPGLMYDDARAGAYVDVVDEAGAALWERLGYRRSQTAWALPKLLWLLDERGHRGEVRLAHQVDVVNAALVGHPVATDLSNALKSGADLLTGRWPTDVMDRLGVGIEVLPDLVEPGTRLGEVGTWAAEVTGVPVGTPVHAGVTDGCASQLGAGVVDVGSWISVLGTTLVLKGVARAPVADPDGVVYSHRGPAGRWLPGGASSSGAGVVAAGFGDADLDDLSRRARDHEPSSLLAYPLVSPGERFPFVAPAARAFSEGPDGAGDADRFAAVLQGVAHVERLCLDYLDLLGAPVDGDLVLTGGGSRNRYWCELRAGLRGRPVRVAPDADAAVGAAVLAASGTGDTAPAARAMTGRGRTVEPRADRAWLVDGYVRLVDSLEGRGWLDAAVAAHARKQVAA